MARVAHEQRKLPSFRGMDDPCYPANPYQDALYPDMGVQEAISYGCNPLLWSSIDVMSTVNGNLAANRLAPDFGLPPAAPPFVAGVHDQWEAEAPILDAGFGPCYAPQSCLEVRRSPWQAEGLAPQVATPCQCDQCRGALWDMGVPSDPATFPQQPGSLEQRQVFQKQRQPQQQQKQQQQEDMQLWMQQDVKRQMELHSQMPQQYLQGHRLCRPPQFRSVSMRAPRSPGPAQQRTMSPATYWATQETRRRVFGSLPNSTTDADKASRGARPFAGVVASRSGAAAFAPRPRSRPRSQRAQGVARSKSCGMPRALARPVVRCEHRAEPRCGDPCAGFFPATIAGSDLDKIKSVAALREKLDDEATVSMRLLQEKLQRQIESCAALLQEEPLGPAERPVAQPGQLSAQEEVEASTGAGITSLDL